MPENTDGNDLPVSNTPLFASGEKIAKVNVAEEIKNSFLDYSMSVIISRALPDARDGLRHALHRAAQDPPRRGANGGHGSGHGGFCPELRRNPHRTDRFPRRVS